MALRERPASSMTFTNSTLRVLALGVTAWGLATGLLLATLVHAGPVGSQGIRGDTGTEGAWGAQGHAGPVGPVGLSRKKLGAEYLRIAGTVNAAIDANRPVLDNENATLHQLQKAMKNDKAAIWKFNEDLREVFSGLSDESEGNWGELREAVDALIAENLEWVNWYTKLVDAHSMSELQDIAQYEQPGEGAASRVRSLLKLESVPA